MTEKVAVIGLGYVGLPVAVACARHFETVGFDIQTRRIVELREGYDRTGEVESERLKASSLRYTDQSDDLRDSTFYIVTVPTPIDDHRRPDLGMVAKASETVGRYLKRGDVVVYESTVYPGVTEELCGSILARVSGLVCGQDFKLGYSPERINPGDREHSLERVVKIVAGEDEATLERICAVYGSFVEAGLHRAPTIKVAEAAKVIENIQRDLNIALMNELALIFERLDIRTIDVLAAAGTKWNFLPFRPGLVGGHCIGVDPYYLTSKAEMTGYHPAVILAGRRINDGMGAYVAQRMIKMMVKAQIAPAGKRVGVLGLTFKEDVNDLRNSRVPDIVRELQEFGVQPLVFDPVADPEEALAEYGFALSPWEAMRDLDGLILAVAHQHFRRMPLAQLLGGLNKGGVIGDIKSILDPRSLPSDHLYWSL